MKVNCHKLKQSLPGLDEPPYPGPLGERVYQHISAQAWDMWLERQTMLINEYRMDPLDPEDRQKLEQAMEQFLFEEGEGELPPGYQAME